jgi:hypothetical protein
MIDAGAPTHSPGAASRTALSPWLASLTDLQRWLADHAPSIWPDHGERRAADLLNLLRETLESLARGEQAVLRPSELTQAAPTNRIDTLLAGRAQQHVQSVSSSRARRRAVLNLGLWNALRRLGETTPSMAALHAALAAPAALAPGLTPALQFAAMPSARGFFDNAVRGVLAALARKHDRDGARYASVAPEHAFECSLPSLAAWSQAWSVAVAGVWLDNLQRHAANDLSRVLCHLWSDAAERVRFRAGAGMTALPAHAGDLHLDLWTCAVKAQALAFDGARWRTAGGGRRWHTVRIDMHELGAGEQRLSGNGAAQRSRNGLGVEALYQTVFIDRVQALCERAGATDAQAPHEQTIEIEMERPRSGHLPNLKMLVRWRDPGREPLRFADGGPETSLSAADRQALQGLIERHADAALSHELDARAIDWRGAVSARVADETGVAPAALGDGLLWPALDAAVQWIDPALLVRCDGRWYELPVLIDEAADGRTCWLLARDSAWPPRLDVQRLRDGLATAGAVIWLAHETGLGAFVMAAVDVDPSQPAAER